MAEWNSEKYLKFERERTQPSLDLISRLSGDEPKRIIDLGCGPGNCTHVLYERFKNAEILGVDASDDMLNKAEKTYPYLKFKKCLLPDGLEKEDGKFDLIFSNACIQWIPDQKRLFEAVFSRLNKGGIFAVQVPLRQNSPFYIMFSKFLNEGKWSFLTSTDVFHNLSSSGYYNLLCEFTSEFTMWETMYFHTVDSFDSVIDWYSSSGLRPYFERMDEETKSEFLSDLKKRISEEYTIMANGKVVLKMPRLFFTAVKE